MTERISDIYSYTIASTSHLQSRINPMCAAMSMASRHGLHVMVIPAAGESAPIIPEVPQAHEYAIGDLVKIQVGPDTGSFGKVSGIPTGATGHIPVIANGRGFAVWYRPDEMTPATPSAAVGADGPVDDVTEWCDGAKEFCERQVESDTVPRSEYDRVVKLNHHLREVAVMAIVERVPSDTEEADWKRRQKIRKAAKEYSESTTADYEVPSDSKPTNVRNPESEDTPAHNPVMGPVVGTATVRFEDTGAVVKLRDWCQKSSGTRFPEPSPPISDTVSPEVGKRYVCRNGEVTPAMKSDTVTGRNQPYYFCDIDGTTTYWGHDGRGYVGRQDDLIAEYHEPEPSTPAESPDDWVTQDRFTMRECDQIRWINVDTDLPFSNHLGEWSDVVDPVRQVSHGFIDSGKYRLELRCRRKDLPVVTAEPKTEPETIKPVLPQFPKGADNNTVLWGQAAAWSTLFTWCHENGMPLNRGLNGLQTVAQWILDLKAAAKTNHPDAAPADKPRMRQVTLREYKIGSRSYWTTSDDIEPATGRTCVTEVPE